jgi:hypothetical protein
MKLERHPVRQGVCDMEFLKLMARPGEAAEGVKDVYSRICRQILPDR